MTVSAARLAFIAAAVCVVFSEARGLPAPQATPRTAQQPTPPPPVSYAVDVSLVEVDVVVTDAEGKVIRDLGRDQFHVFEDGRPQAVDRMALIEIPIERADAADGERSYAYRRNIAGEQGPSQERRCKDWDSRLPV